MGGKSSAKQRRQCTQNCCLAERCFLRVHQGIRFPGVVRVAQSVMDRKISRILT
ncbi:hypothetical protein HMPREF3197_03580 [Klebsiella pneumoniae]|nr:hypothetical protein HMPREF3197_03580 [Klebsiella pneumoniae]